MAERFPAVSPMEDYTALSIEDLRDRVLSRLQQFTSQKGRGALATVDEPMASASEVVPPSPPEGQGTTPLPGEIEETTEEEVEELEPGGGLSDTSSEPFYANARVSAARAALERQRRLRDQNLQEETV